MTSTAKMKNSPVAPFIQDVNGLIREYKINSLKLNSLADQVPVDGQSIENGLAQETKLLKQQAMLMSNIQAQPVRSMQEAKLSLELWRLAKFVEQVDGRPSPVDELALVACQYILSLGDDVDVE